MIVNKSCRGQYHGKVQNGMHIHTMWRSETTDPTVGGDSGAPWIAETGYGPVIVGLHSKLHNQTIPVCSAVFFEDVQLWAAPQAVQVGTIEVIEPIVQKDRSYIDYHKERRMTYHGELDGFRMRPKHHVYETEIADQVLGRTIGTHLVERRLVAPVMDTWRPQQVALHEMVTPVSTMNEVFLEECVDTFFVHCIESLPKEELELLHPYPLEVAVNGAPGITFVDSIKKSTSMGYPWRTTKRKYIVPLEDIRFQDGVKFTPEVEERILDRLERLKKGVRLHPVFSASLKDEPVSLKKFAACKTRVFFCCPADFLVLVRMCFMSFCRLVMRNPYVFCVAIGLNPHSSDWQKVWDHLSQFPFFELCGW